MQLTQELHVILLNRSVPALHFTRGKSLAQVFACHTMVSIVWTERYGVHVTYSVELYKHIRRSRLPVASDVHFPSHSDFRSIGVDGAPAVEEIVNRFGRAENDDVTSENGEVYYVAYTPSHRSTQRSKKE